MADPDVPGSSMASTAATTAPASSTLENAGSSSSGNCAGDSGSSGQPAYWCYQCRKQVMVEAERSGSEQGPSAGMICTECRSGFVEAVSTAQTDDVRHQEGDRAAAAIVTTTTRRRRRRGNGTTPTQTLSLSEALGQLYPQQLVQVLQLLGQAARANDNNNSNNNEQQQHQQDREGEGRSDNEASAENNGGGASQGRVLIVSEEDQDDNHDTNLWGEEEDDDGESDSDVEQGMQLRLEDLDSVDDDDEIEDEDDEDEWEEVEDEDGAAGEGENATEDEVAGAQNEQQQQQQSEEHHQDHHHRRNGRGRREAHATRGPRNLHRYLQELLQNLVGQNIEVRVEVPEYVGNPGDYVDARGFQLLMQQLAENDNSRRGAPPAAKSAVNRLPSILIEQSHLDDDSAVCAVCKDTVCLGESAKQMPCLHLYHAECILPWLSTRNSCPVCRYELPTDDPDYEDQKRNHRSRIRTQSSSSQTVRSSSEQTERWGSPPDASLQVSDVGVVSGDVASSSRQVEQEQVEVHSGVVSSGGVAEGGELQGAPRAGRLRRARPSSGRGWLLLTAGPVISMVGLVLVICLGNHLMGSSSSQQQTQPPRQQLQEPCLEQIAGSSDSQSRRRWWWLPFQQR